MTLDPEAGCSGHVQAVTGTWTNSRNSRFLKRPGAQSYELNTPLRPRRLTLSVGDRNSCSIILHPARIGAKYGPVHSGIT